MARGEQKVRNHEFDFDGVKVTLTEIEREYYEWGIVGSDETEKQYKERRRWEVAVNGDVCAVVVHPYGFGKQPFQVFRKIANYYSSYYGDTEASTRFSKSTRLDLEALAREIANKRLNPEHPYETFPTEAEFEAKEAEERERKRLEEIEHEREREQWRREAEEKKREEERIRSETVEGLLSIRDRLELTNFEAAALETALARFRK